MAALFMHLIGIGAANVMIESEWPSFANRAPRMDASSPVAIFVYVEDVDHAVQRAVAGGAKVIRPIENQFWGDRIGWIMDPSGHVWSVASRVEETTEEERLERLAKQNAESAAGAAHSQRYAQS
jgi:PhnB protein